MMDFSYLIFLGLVVYYSALVYLELHGWIIFNLDMESPLQIHQSDYFTMGGDLIHTNPKIFKDDHDKISLLVASRLIFILAIH